MYGTILTDFNLTLNEREETVAQTLFIFLLSSSELLILKWVCSNSISCLLHWNSTAYVDIVADFYHVYKKTP